MRALYVRGFALVACILVVLAMPASVQNAAAQTKTYADGPTLSSEWSDSKYTGDLADTSLNGSTENAKLQYQTSGRSLGDFDSYDSKDPDWGTSFSSAYLAEGKNKGDTSTPGGSKEGFNRHPPASAYGSDGDLYFMADSIHRFSSDGSSHQSQVCDAAGNTAGQPRGLASGNGYSGSVIVGAYDGPTLTYNLYSVSLSSCDFSKIGDISGGPPNRGLAQDESANDIFYIIDGNDNGIDRVDASDGSTTSNFIDIPQGKQRGLDVHEWPNGDKWYFVGYTTGGNQDNYVLVLDSNGNILDEYSPGGDWAYNPVYNDRPGASQTYANIIGMGDNDDNNDGGNLYSTAPTYNWADDGSGDVVYTGSLSTESGISDHWMNTSVSDREVTWTVDQFDSAYKGGSGRLDFEGYNGNTWVTLDSVSPGSTGEFSASLPGSFDGLNEFQFRVRMVGNHKVKSRTSDSPNVQIGGFSWDYSWYSTDGVIESTRLNTQDVKEFTEITVEGVDGGQDVTIELLDKNGNVLTSQDKSGSSPPWTLDVSGVTIDDSVEYVYVRTKLQTDGLSTPQVSGWQLTYEGNPSAAVESYSAVVGEDDTLVESQTSVTSEIGSQDEFTIESVNQTIDSVTWKVNGNTIKSQDVSSKGPFSATYTWGNAQTGVNSVTAELENRNGTTSRTWDVNVPSPTTVKYGTVDIIRGETQAGASASETVSVDFPGDNQTITTDVGTQYDVAVDVSNQNVTYNLTMSVSDPINTSVTVTDIEGDYVSSTLTDSLNVHKSRNFDGEYEVSVSIENTNNGLTTWDVSAVYKQQVTDSRSTPDVEQVKLPTSVHRGEAFDVSAEVSSDITSVRETWLRVENPAGDVTREAIANYANTAENESVSYTAQPTLDETGTYEITVVGENYDRINGTSRTYVVDARNAPPEGEFIDPPTQVDANRSFRIFWDVSDPEGDQITDTGIILTSPSGEKINLTDDEAGAGEHSLTVDPGTVTDPGLWAIQTWQQDDKGGYSISSRVIVDVVSLQEYKISNSSVALWDGTTFDQNERQTLHAGRDVQVGGEITPNVSTTLNGTVYVNLETQSGSLVSELYTATSVELQNGTAVNLSEVNNDEVVEERLPTDANGTYVVEVGVVSDNGEATYRIPVEVIGVTSGEVQSVSLNKREAFPPEFVTATSTIFNNGEQNTNYDYTVRVSQNGTTYLEESVNSTNIRAGDTATTGLGFQIPKTLKPGDYTVELLISSPEYPEWGTFDRTSIPITIQENRQAGVDEVDLSYESGVIQGYVTIENDGNVPLSDGSARLIVSDGDTDERIAIEDTSIPSIPVGTSRQKSVNFNFSAEENSTYHIEIQYEESNVTDTALTQIATAPRPSMQVVDIDGPGEVVQGENATYTVTVNNNGDVDVDSASLVVQLQTGEDETVVERGVAVSAASPGDTRTVDVTLPVNDPSLLGRSQVSVVGQAHDGNNTTRMLPRNEEIFVSAPGFIISGDSSFSDLNVGESFTVTETFLVVGRPDAAIDVTIEYDEEKLVLDSGDQNQTVTSGSSLSWTFIVREPIGDSPVRIIAESGSESKAKDVSVSTVGTQGFIGNVGSGISGIDGYDDLWTNMYVESAFPGYDDGFYALTQWFFALLLVAILQFADFTTGFTPLQKHGGSLIVAGWVSGLLPIAMVVLTAVYGVGVYIEVEYGTGEFTV